MCFYFPEEKKKQKYNSNKNIVWAKECANEKKMQRKKNNYAGKSMYFIYIRIMWKYDVAE